MSSDIRRKKNSQDEKQQLDSIEKSVRHFIEYSISNISHHFTPLQNIISPLVNKLQVHLDVFTEHTQKKGTKIS